MEWIEQYLPDGVVVVIFLCFAAGYARRGLYKSLAGVIVTVTAVLGALLLSYLLAGVVTDIIYPWVADRFAEKVDLSGVRAGSPGGVAEQLQALLPEGFLSLLRKLGMQVGAFVPAAADAKSAAADAVSAMLYAVTAAVTRIVLFVLFLLILRLLLSGVKNALGLAIRLPVIRWIDVMGGAVLGLIVCAVALYAALWLCDLFRAEAVVSLASRSRILTEFLKL